MKSYICNFLTVMFLSTLFSNTGLAHDAGVTDTNITVIKDSVSLIYTVPREHLTEITGDEIKADSIKLAIEAVQAGFTVKSKGTTCKMTSAATRNMSEINSRQFAYLHKCDESINSLQIDYNLLFKDDPAHKNFARVAYSGISKNVTFTQNNRSIDIDLEITAQKQNALEKAGAAPENLPLLQRITAGSNYFPVGLEHILLGPDHLLFLAALLLLPLRLRHILALITTFTISHSITLALSVMDIVSLKPGFVEMTIALSIVYMAVETIYLLRCQANKQSSRYLSGGIVYKRIAVTALFGLIHGFGFSFFLKQIGLGDQLLSSLLFFNLGVEAGQLLAMIVFLPLVTYLFKRFASTLWAQSIAVLIGILGLIWLVERTNALLA